MPMPGFFSHVALEKGYRTAYNYLHYQTFYNTRRPWLVKLLRYFQPYPAYIELEITTYCNLKCAMCEHTYWNEKPRSMNFDQFKAVVDQFPYLKWIGLTGIGESYLNPDFHRILRHCKEDLGLIVEIFDAFYFVDETRARELVEMGVDQIYCSLDGATKETYEKIRVGSDFDKVIQNIRNFVKIKNSRGQFFPVLDFHFIISKINYHEIIPYIELIADIAPGSKILFTRLLHSYQEIDSFFMDIPTKIMEEANELAARLNVKLTWNMNTACNKPLMKDCVTWYMPFIFVTGEVIPCCSGNEANRREFQKATSLGNIFEKPFSEIWWGNKYKKLRKQLRNGERPEACADCCLYTHPENQQS